MYKLTTTLNSQIENTTIFFDKDEAEEAKRLAAERGEEPVLEETCFEKFVKEARDAMYDDFGIWEMLTNCVNGVPEIFEKAHKHDVLREKQRKNAVAINNSLTPEELSERNRKAVQARWNKR